MSFIGNIGMHVGEQVVDSALGLTLGALADKRQLKQTGRLLKQQSEFDKGMMEFGKELALRQWKDTGVVGQVKQLEEAGMSPGLAYSPGGAGGGATTNIAQGGVDSAKANVAQEILGLQMATSQRKLLEAQARKTEVEANKIEGVDTAIAETNLKQLKQEYQFYVDSYEASFEKIENEAAILADQARMMRNNREISDETKLTEIEMKQGELIGIGLINELKREQIKLTQEQIDKTTEEIAQRWEELSISRKNAMINGDRLALERFIRDVPDSVKLTVETVSKVVSGIVSKSGGTYTNTTYDEAGKHVTTKKF